MVLEVEVLPCPFLGLSEAGDRTLCGLVAIEAAAGLPPILAESLGIGLGCSLPDGIEISMKEFLNGGIEELPGGCPRGLGRA